LTHRHESTVPTTRVARPPSPDAGVATGGRTIDGVHRVVLLPGGVLPAAPAYGALVAALGAEVDAHPKDLEVYDGDEPPAGYTIATEVDGIARAADDAGFDRFHLVGYSGGGAASLAFAAAQPQRLLSLALMEPAFAGWQRMRAPERAHFERFRAILDLDDAAMFPAFQALQLAPGVDRPTPPPGPAPPWMAKRPAALRAMLNQFLTTDLDLDVLRGFEKPVWFAVGGRSNPDYFARMAVRLAGVFPDFTIERFPERHHFDPPHRIEPERVAASLRKLWARAEEA
jgi:pimeloyl-ACP methyl ester carboxylesterase